MKKTLTEGKFSKESWDAQMVLTFLAIHIVLQLPVATAPAAAGCTIHSIFEWWKWWESRRRLRYHIFKTHTYLYLHLRLYHLRKHDTHIYIYYVILYTQFINILWSSQISTIVYIFFDHGSMFAWIFFKRDPMAFPLISFAWKNPRVNKVLHPIILK